MEQIKKKKRRRKVKPRFYVIVGLFLLVIILLLTLLISLISWMACTDCGEHPSSCEGEETVEAEQSQKPGFFEMLFATATPSPSPTPSPTPTPTPTPRPTPYFVAESNPEQYGFVPHVEVDGVEVDANSFQRPEPITFPDASSYNEVKGILTFRGNNWRNQSSTDTVNLTEFKLREVWSSSIGALEKGSASGNWSGCGWTGQPLIVQWPEATRKVMNLYDWAKAKADLVEVIYPTEDGNIYFYDLETGQKTRDTIVMRVPFKGTGSVDPRGYPLLYIGSGDEYENDSQKARAYIISLINGTVLYEFGKQGTDSFAKRNWYAYDSAPIVDAETDTLIYPGENGIVYTMRLNSVFNATLGSVSVDPSNVVKFRYDANNSYTEIDVADSAHKWLGYEGSCVAWNGFLYLSSNDGLFQCIDLNTMQIKWVADTLDDTNGSPVLDVLSDTEAYLYVGTSLHFNKDSNNTGIAPFFKINAMTGEIVRQYGLTVHTVSGVSGGIQSTAVVGQKALSKLVYISIARYPNKDDGILVALDKETFEVVWSKDMRYSWSSPAVVYDQSGMGYIIQADSVGNIYLLDGLSGEVKDKIAPTDSNFEASPAIFGNMLVVGCRGDQTIFGIRLS